MKKIYIAATILFAFIFQNAYSQVRLFGIMTGGGAHSNGTIYEYYNGAAYDRYDFLTTDDGQDFTSDLVLAADSMLYSIANSGGWIGGGTLIQFNPKTRQFKKKLDMGYTQCSDPYGTLIQASNGYLYGISGSAGSLFKYNLATSACTQVTSSNSLLRASDYMTEYNGKLYGITASTVYGQQHKVFKYDLIAGTLTTTQIISDSIIGSDPNGLTLASDGKMYGVSVAGGSNANHNGGIFYRYDPSNDSCVFLAYLDGSDSTGGVPNGHCTEGINGKIYGITNMNGAIFEYNSATQQFRVSLHYTASLGSLTLASDSNMYGVSNVGGNTGEGYIFRYNYLAGYRTTLIDVDGTYGVNTARSTPVQVILDTAANIVVSNTTNTVGLSINTLAGTLQLKASLLPNFTTITSPAWSVNDTSLATINSSGLVTARNNGIVTVTAVKNGLSGSAQVTITNQCVPISHTINQNICQGQSFLFNGINRTSSGTYIDTLQNIYGCDSIITLHLTLNSVSATAVYDTICGGQFYSFAGSLLTASGTYSDTLQNRFGCDSIVTLYLIVHQSSFDSISVSICNGQSYHFGNSTISATGTYIDTFQNIYGCDSVVILHLTTNQSQIVSHYDSICSGQSYSFAGSSLTASGVYSDTLQNSYGCDSVITLHLTVNQPSNVFISDSICNGQTYQFGNSSLIASGTYTDTLQNVNGCDSVVTLHLTVNLVSATTFYDSIYNGQTYQFGNSSLTTSSIYADTLQNSYGCDSVVILNLTVKDCHAYYTLYPDTTTPHNWLALNQATGTGALTYLWSWGDGANSTGATPSHIYSTAGNYNICLTISDNSGCTDTYCDTNYVYKTEGIVTINVVEQLPTGISPLSFGEGMRLFPNPATDQLNIQITDYLLGARLSMYDVTGKLIETTQLTTVNLQLSTESYSSGVYIAEVKMNGAVHSVRWAKM